MNSVSEKEPWSISHTIGDRDGNLEKKIDDLEKRFNVEIAYLKIYVEENFFVLKGKTYEKFSILEKKLDKILK